MNILNQIYDNEIPKINFLERKQAITCNNTIIYGPPKSGKTYLIYDYLSQYKKNEYLYIDLENYKNKDQNIEIFLDEFIKNNTIKVLVLENFNFDFQLPKVTSTIITTKVKKTFKGFCTIELFNLDFEEYLLFDTKHQNISHSFNTFLKYGNQPEILEYNENKKTNRNEEICKLYCNDQTKFEILMMFIKSSGEKKSLYQLFTQMKKYIKISKDRFYKTALEFEDTKIIYFIEKFDQPRAVKKLFLYNHSLIDLASYQKKFNNLFSNMVFLELLKQYNDIFYLEKIDFYIPNAAIAIFCIPFFNNMQIENLKKILASKIEKYKIEKVFIITVSTEFEIKIKDLNVDVITFYNWVLSK